MGNDVTISPLVIDTAGAGDILVASAPVWIGAFQWDPGAGGVDGNRVVVTDTAGKELWSATLRTGYLGLQNFALARPMFAKGLKVTTLAAGKLFIYLDGV